MMGEKARFVWEENAGCEMYMVGGWATGKNGQWEGLTFGLGWAQ